jgi:hypothetical protein
VGEAALGLVEFNGNTRTTWLTSQLLKIRLASSYTTEDPDPNQRFKLVYEVSPLRFVLLLARTDTLERFPQPPSQTQRHRTNWTTKFNGCYYLVGKAGM